MSSWTSAAICFSPTDLYPPRHQALPEVVVTGQSCCQWREVEEWDGLCFCCQSSPSSSTPWSIRSGRSFCTPDSLTGILVVTLPDAIGISNPPNLTCHHHLLSQGLRHVWGGRRIHCTVDSPQGWWCLWGLRPMQRNCGSWWASTLS